jgi:hypothetical protein
MMRAERNCRVCAAINGLREGGIIQRPQAQCRVQLERHREGRHCALRIAQLALGTGGSVMGFTFAEKLR